MRRSMLFNFVITRKYSDYASENSETIYKKEDGTIASDGLTVVYIQKGAPPSPNLC